MARRYIVRAPAGEMPQQGFDPGVPAITLQDNVPDVDSDNFLTVSTTESNERAVIAAGDFLTITTTGSGTITFDGIFMQVNI